jgi:ATP-dependent DNA ligase
MAATLTEERFEGPEWLFERKFDGIRLVAYKDPKGVRLYSRTRNLQDVPAIAEAIARLPVRDAILDGEMTWDARDYHVFDVLWLDGKDLRDKPLEERRAILKKLPLAAPLHRVAELTGPRPWERACADGWEGVIAKRRDSPYEGKRSKHWLKMKCELTEDFVIGGFTDPQGARVGLGALLIGKRDGKDLAFAGKVGTGTGLGPKLLLELRRRLDALEIPTSPFTRAVGLPRRAHWVRPEIACRVSFIEWTESGKLRHPRMVEVRLP